MATLSHDLPDGLALAYADEGRRAPLVLIHGWPLDRELWAPQVAAFAGTRRLVLPDLVGAGRSAPGGRASVEAHAADVVSLMDALGLPRAVVAGLSMGGYVALALARSAPERLAGLVLADTRAEADSPEQREGRARTARQAAEEGLGALAASLLPKLLSPAANEELRGLVRAMIERQPVAGVVAALGAMVARPDARSSLGAITAPTLVLVGARDAITPPEASEALAEAIPGARLVVVPGAGHLANIEEPGAFNAALRSFLADLDAQGG
jgi:pimeloyl-ACP methyl ester carboxylesterase